jgi:ATP-dependent Clp protease protease subunit
LQGLLLTAEPPAAEPLERRTVACPRWLHHDPEVPMTSPPIPTGSLDDQLTARLLHQRIIVLGQEVDDGIANRLCAELLLLSAEDAQRDISLYINSPGGSVSAGLAIYDTMRLIPNDVSTLAMGLAASMGQFLLSAGTPG